MLGNFLRRNCDGEPGVKTLWLGMHRLRDFVESMEQMAAIYNAKCVMQNGTHYAIGDSQGYFLSNCPNFRARLCPCTLTAKGI